MTPVRRRLLLACAVLGLAASSASSYVHHKLLTVPGYASACDISSTLNCTQAYLSPYGSLFGIPVALAGVFFFGFVLVLAGLTGAKGSAARDTAPAYIFLASTVGLAFVLYLAWASYFILETVCILCTITYASVIGILVLSAGALKAPMTKLPSRAARDVRTLVTTPRALAIAAVFAAAVVTVVAMFPQGQALSIVASAQEIPKLTDKERAEFERWYAVQPTVDVPVPRDGAKVLIVKFSDFQCPACKQTHDAYRTVLAKYAPSQVKFVLKHYPLEPECNSAVTRAMHPAACEAAAAAVMARTAGRTERMTDWLFANQSTLSPASVKQGASDVARVDDFDAQYARALQEVKTDASLGSRLQVTSTPTFFVNGKRVGGLPPQYFEAIIELELKKAK